MAEDWALYYKILSESATVAWDWNGKWSLIAPVDKMLLYLVKAIQNSHVPGIYHVGNNIQSFQLKLYQTESG